MKSMTKLITPFIMNYHISATSYSNQAASLHINESNIKFGTTSNKSETLPNPAELFLGSFAACILKNVERFSILMNFEYVLDSYYKYSPDNHKFFLNHIQIYE